VFSGQSKQVETSEFTTSDTTDASDCTLVHFLGGQQKQAAQQEKFATVDFAL
jgi:hypothetical protein